MRALGRVAFRSAAARGARSLLRARPAAAAFCWIYERAPEGVRDSLRVLWPRWGTFAAGRDYRVRRRALRLVLDPNDFSQWRRIYGVEDPALAALLRLVRPGGTVLDVGANIGFYAMCVARAVGPRGRVICFEPNPATRQRLETHLRINRMTNVMVVCRALGETRGELVLNPPDWLDSGSYNLRPPVAGDAASGIPVVVDTLDDVVAELGLERVDVLKIDVEGWEPEVILGGRRTIARDRPVMMFELTPEWCASRPRNLLESFAFLNDQAYELFELDHRGAPTLHPFRLSRVLGADRQYDVVALPAGTPPPLAVS